MVNQLTFGPPLDELLDRLYAASDSQTARPRRISPSAQPTRFSIAASSTRERIAS